MDKDQIVQYYDACETDYRLLWDLEHSHAMHAGYWDETTRSLRQALRRENEILAQLAEIKNNDYVLDAGCGVGGSSIFLSQTYHCSVMGITLSAQQVQTAEKKVCELGLQEKVHFKKMDFTCTDFPANHFDVVWAIESVCHANNKHAFIKEAFRLLKPNGRLIVADGFNKKQPTTIHEKNQMKCWLSGWGVSELESTQKFEEALKDTGFHTVKFLNITNHVLPSSRRLYWYSWPAIPLSKIGEILGLRTSIQTANLYSARCQYQTLKKNLWEYGIFYARKS